MKAMVTLSALVFALAGCGTAAAQPPVPDYRVFVAGSSSRTLVMDTGTGELNWWAPGGLLGPDGRTLYSTAMRGGTTVSTQLVVTDLPSGQTVRATQLDGLYEILPGNGYAQTGAGLSPNGRWLALTGGSRGVRPDFLVVDTTGTTAPRHAALEGDWSFDALSNDGDRLYLLQYADARHAQYHVRMYDLHTGRLASYVIAEKGEENQPMTGFATGSVASPDGSWLFTLYTGAAKGAFIHALPIGLAQPWALCIDLPASTATPGQADTWSVAGGRGLLYAVNALTATVVVISTNPNDNRPQSVFRLAAPAPSGSAWLFKDAQAKEFGAGPGQAAVSPDGRWLYAAGSMSGISRVETQRLGGRRQIWLPGSQVTSFVLSRDGRWIFAATSSKLVFQVDAATGEVRHRLQVGGPAGITVLGAAPA